MTVPEDDAVGVVDSLTGLRTDLGRPALAVVALLAAGAGAAAGWTVASVADGTLAAALGVVAFVGTFAAAVLTFEAGVRVGKRS